MYMPIFVYFSRDKDAIIFQMKAADSVQRINL